MAQEERAHGIIGVCQEARGGVEVGFEHAKCGQLRSSTGPSCGALRASAQASADLWWNAGESLCALGTRILDMDIAQRELRIEAQSTVDPLPCTAGPVIPWRPGRSDQVSGDSCGPDGRLPDATQVSRVCTTELYQRRTIGAGFHSTT